MFAVIIFKNIVIPPVQYGMANVPLRNIMLENRWNIFRDRIRLISARQADNNEKE